MFYHLKKYRENSKKKKKKKKKSYSSCRNKGLKCYDQWEKIFGQPVKNDLATYDNIKKIAVGQGDDYTTGCLLDYNYFKDYFKIIAIDWSKQQTLDSDLKVMKQINFTGNLNRCKGVNDNTTIFFNIEEAF